MPVVFSQRVLKPTAVFWLPVVLLKSAWAPMPTLLLPAVSKESAWLPTAVLLAPIVTEMSAWLPRLVLDCACAVLQRISTAAQFTMIQGSFFILYKMVHSGPALAFAGSARKRNVPREATGPSPPAWPRRWESHKPLTSIH